MTRTLLLLAALASAAFAEDRVATPFKGITITQRTEAGPPREAVFIADIDLTTPGLRFTTTEPNGDAPRDTNTETTLEFVKRKHAQLGINANFFSYDKQENTDVRGLAFSDGVQVSPWESHKNALNISRDNVATIVHPVKDEFTSTATAPEVSLYNTVCGGMMLVESGKNVAHGDGKRHPRTCVGLKPARHLLLVVVDGRHPDHSEGMTHEELGALMLTLGATDAMELDGGGSATFVVADPEPTVLNVPLGTPIPAGLNIGPPGFQRPNGNNIAVFAEK